MGGLCACVCNTKWNYAFSVPRVAGRKNMDPRPLGPVDKDGLPVCSFDLMLNVPLNS